MGKEVHAVEMAGADMAEEAHAAGKEQWDFPEGVKLKRDQIRPGNLG
jgi:hypothetical protein